MAAAQRNRMSLRINSGIRPDLDGAAQREAAVLCKNNLPATSQSSPQVRLGAAADDRRGGGKSCKKQTQRREDCSDSAPSHIRVDANHN